MKIRTGFVTNSSSSSYIIALPEDMRLVEMYSIIAQIPARKEDDFSDSSVFKEQILNIEEFRDAYCGCDKKHKCESCLAVKKALEQGHKVFHVNVSYYDGTGMKERFAQFRKAYPNVVLVDLS